MTELRFGIDIYGLRSDSSLMHFAVLSHAYMQQRVVIIHNHNESSDLQFT